MHVLARAAIDSRRRVAWPAGQPATGGVAARGGLSTVTRGALETVLVAMEAEAAVLIAAAMSTGTAAAHPQRIAGAHGLANVAGVHSRRATIAVVAAHGTEWCAAHIRAA
jgi:hypothetical protein